MMMKRSPNDLQTLLSESSPVLNDFSDRYRLIQKINQYLQSRFDVKEQILHVGNITQEVLILETYSPVWSSRLKYETESILRDLNQKLLLSLQKIEIRTTPNAVFSAKPKQSTNKGQRKLSQQSAASILEIAEHAPKELREKLERLAARSLK